MATHSSILAWKIPWMEEPDRLQFMGSQSRTRLSDFTFLYPQYNEACNDTNIKGLGSFAMNLKENFSCTKDVYNVNSLSLKMNSLSMLCQLLSIK